MAVEEAFVHDAVKILQRMEEYLLEPVARALGSDPPRKVFVVPHRALWAYPFSLLQRRLPQTKFCVIPSMAMLPLGRREARRTAPKTGERHFICDATRSLAGARSEVASLHGFTGLDASEHQALFEKLSGTSLLHFAGHGFFDRSAPILSGLITAPSASKDPLLDACWGNYGVLTCARILARGHMPEAYLATLSGCSTAVARDHGSSDFGSLPTAFFLAGVRNVVASLWPVNDHAARLLMRRFYRCLEAGATPSSAMATARQEIESISYEEAVEELGTSDGVMPKEQPYASPIHSLAFQHYGFD